MAEVARLLFDLLESASLDPVEYDPEWSSPCEILPPDASGCIRWQPVAMNVPNIFEGIPIHPDLHEFYGSYWGGTIYGQHADESVIINVAWNDRDLDRINEFVRMQIFSGEAVFIANTDSDLYFGTNNSNGSVWLCEPGYSPMREIAPSLAAFLAEI